MEKVKTFHGTPARGVLIGWFMINLAPRHLPPGRLFDALGKTAMCLPDAIQLLTSYFKERLPKYYFLLYD
ncbi:MAG: formylmethanofuran dehydrogenase subunit E family protein [Thermodesulfobacteriota bacterium]